MRSLHMNLKVNDKSFFVKGHERHVQQIGHRALSFFKCEMSARCAPCSTAAPRSGDSVQPKCRSATCGAVSTDVELLSVEATWRRGASDGSARISIVGCGRERRCHSLDADIVQARVAAKAARCETLSGAISRDVVRAQISREESHYQFVMKTHGCA